jgi:hypothetical protein
LRVVTPARGNEDFPNARLFEKWTLRPRLAFLLPPPLL